MDEERMLKNVAVLNEKIVLLRKNNKSDDYIKGYIDAYLDGFSDGSMYGSKKVGEAVENCLTRLL